MTIDTEQYTQFFKQGQDAVRTTVDTPRDITIPGGSLH